MADQPIASGPRTCPRCGLLSPASAAACECGLVFEATGTKAAGPRGIGGWLVLMAIGLVVQPFRLLGFLAQGLKTLEGDTWRRLTTPSSPAYHPAWGAVIVVELLANVAFLAGACVLLYLFFTKRALFPKVAVGFLAASAIFQVAELAVGYALLGNAAATGKDIGPMMLVVLSAVIWTLYLLQSRRVANTFVN